MGSRALISVFTRIPQAGQSKTRLIPLLGPEGAARTQREMTEHVIRQARMLERLEGGVALEARVTGGSTGDARAWLGVPASLQGEGDLGARLAYAFAEGAGRADVVGVLGADCPTVTANDLHVLLAEAGHHGAAVIPATDGGFCALSLVSRAAEDAGGLLVGIDWGTDRVCAQTVARLEASGLAVRALPARADVDRPDDLRTWEAVRRAWYDPPESLAVVVTVLDEAEHLPALLDRLAGEDVEVVVADGGSTDGSVEIADEAGVRVVTAFGRAAQMNAGAAVTEADALLFLHADTLPPVGFRELALDAASRDGVVLGTFTFATDWSAPSMRIIEFGTRIRGRWLRFPYGDQGLLCRRVVFEALGGFPDIPVMEDYEFVRRARRVGEVIVLPQKAVTSARRWREAGPWRWTLLNLLTVVRHRRGVPPQELAEWRAAYSKR